MIDEDSLANKTFVESEKPVRSGLIRRILEEIENSVWIHDPMGVSAESRLTGWILDLSVHVWKKAGTQKPSQRETFLIARLFCSKHRLERTRSEIQRISELVASKGSREPMKRDNLRTAGLSGDDLRHSENQLGDCLKPS